MTIFDKKTGKQNPVNNEQAFFDELNKIQMRLIEIIYILNNILKAFEPLKKFYEYELTLLKETLKEKIENRTDYDEQF